MMEANRNESGRPAVERERRAPSLSLTTRWTSERAKPRLVTFSWGGTAARR